MIEGCSISKRYGSVAAVDGFSFAIGRGEVFGLMCPNGSGKSTLIRRAALAQTVICSLLVMLDYTVVFLAIGMRLIRNYSESD